MHRKLARHFARDACDHAMKKISHQLQSNSHRSGDFNIEDTMREIAEDAAHDAMKTNNMTGLDKFKNRAKSKQEDG